VEWPQPHHLDDIFFPLPCLMERTHLFCTFFYGFSQRYENASFKGSRVLNFNTLPTPSVIVRFIYIKKTLLVIFLCIPLVIVDFMYSTIRFTTQCDSCALFALIKCIIDRRCLKEKQLEIIVVQYKYVDALKSASYFCHCQCRA
jgi:hypothetical protein